MNSARRQTWVALLEAKVGKAIVEDPQIEAYLAEGRRVGANALITISNDFAVLANHHPTYRGKIGKGITLLHWSWSSILTKCRLLTDGGEIEDPDHSWVIEHLVRFLSHPSTGVTRFDRMPRSWKEVTDAVAAGAGVKKGSEAALEVAAGWIQETRDLGLQLTELLHCRFRNHCTTIPGLLHHDSGTIAPRGDELRGMQLAVGQPLAAVSGPWCFWSVSVPRLSVLLRGIFWHFLSVCFVELAGGQPLPSVSEAA